MARATGTRAHRDTQGECEKDLALPADPAGQAAWRQNHTGFLAATSVMQ